MGVFGSYRGFYITVRISKKERVNSRNVLLNALNIVTTINVL